MAAASLGSATGSRVDSAAKHTMACKVDTKFFRSALGQGGEFADNVLHQNKMKYAMQKDEIVMNTTKKFLTVPGSQAYPLVATTLGDFTSGLMEKFLLCKPYFRGHRGYGACRRHGDRDERTLRNVRRSVGRACRVACSFVHSFFRF
jgi:hypothetical protein